MTNVEIFSAYLPYKVLCKSNNITRELQGIDILGFCWVSDLLFSSRMDEIKLILKPLNTIDWIKCELDMGDYFTDNMSRFIQGYLPERGLHILDAPYLLVQWLIKNHYDVFGAIEKGIAISE